MNPSFLKPFENSPTPCYFLSSSGDFWKNVAAYEQEDILESGHSVERLLNAFVEEMGEGSAPEDVPHLGAAVRLRGLAVLPLEGGLLAILSDVALPPITAVSSELREHLTNILSTLPALNKQMDEDGYDILNSVASNSYALLRLAYNLENLKAVQRPAHLKTIDLTELVRLLINKAVEVCKSPGIPISADLPAQPLPVRADRQLLGEAFLNVLRNSIQYSRDGNEIKISLSVLGRRAILRVEDRGLGIQPEVLGRIFEPYFSCDPYADSGPRPGVGIGLSIVRDAFKGMGGSVTCESRFGEGTTITMAIPLDEAGNRMLESTPVVYTSGRYSPVYVQLSGFCELLVD